MIEIMKGVTLVWEWGFEKLVWKRNKLYYAYISIHFPNKYSGQKGVENQFLTKIEFDMLKG
jgi:hypothetical protein